MFAVCLAFAVHSADAVRFVAWRTWGESGGGGAEDGLAGVVRAGPSAAAVAGQLGVLSSGSARSGVDNWV